jgi:hypothetical protein
MLFVGAFTQLKLCVNGIMDFLGVFIGVVGREAQALD